MCRLLGSVIFFGGQMVMASGEDLIIRLVVKSTCVFIYHLLGSVIFFGGQMATAISEDTIFRLGVKSTCA